MDIGAASKDLKLITGGSGAAMGRANNFLAQSDIQSIDAAAKIPSVYGKFVEISVSKT